MCKVKKFLLKKNETSNFNELKDTWTVVKNQGFMRLSSYLMNSFVSLCSPLDS